MIAPSYSASSQDWLVTRRAWDTCTGISGGILASGADWDSAQDFDWCELMESRHTESPTSHIFRIAGQPVVQRSVFARRRWEF